MDKQLPKFSTYAEANAYVALQIKKHGKGPYTSSPEYHALQPVLVQMYKAENIQPRKRRKLKGVDLRPMWMVAQSQGLI